MDTFLGGGMLVVEAVVVYFLFTKSKNNTVEYERQ